MFRSALPTDELTRALYLLPAHPAHHSDKQPSSLDRAPRFDELGCYAKPKKPRQRMAGHQAVIIWALGLIEQLHSNGRLQ